MKAAGVLKPKDEKSAPHNDESQMEAPAPQSDAAAKKDKPKEPVISAKKAKTKVSVAMTMPGLGVENSL
jgi:hypothetical protein